MLLNIDKGVPSTVLACVMVAGVAAALLAGSPYVPYMVLSIAGLVWWAVCRGEAPGPVVWYVVLGACVVLAVATYADMKQILLDPDITGVLCMVAGLTGLAVVSRWALSRERSARACRPTGK